MRTQSAFKQLNSSILTGFFFTLAWSFALGPDCQAQEEVVLIKDDFDRAESNDDLEQIGNGWGTNSQKRAKGQKQVDLVDGAMKITRARVADHGVSVTHEAAFTDCILTLRFKLGQKDDLGLNIADMGEKTVHAGHLCVARIRLNSLELTDLKTGRMNLARRQRKQAGKETAEDKEIVSKTTKKSPIELQADQWHQLELTIISDRMTLAIDGVMIDSFKSPGIGHPTKSRLRLSVNRNAWVDDLKLVKMR